MEKMKRLPASGPRLPLDMNRIGASITSSQKVTKKEEKELQTIAKRLSELAKEKKAPSSIASSSTTPTIIAPNKEKKKDQILSSELQTGLDASSLSYVEAKPDENFSSLSEKTSQMLLSEEKLKEISAMAPGAQKMEIKPKMGKKKLKKARKLERE